LKRPLPRWAVLAAPAVALVALASHAQTSSPSGLAATTYAFTDIEAMWQRATGGQPADAAWIAFLAQQLESTTAPSSTPPPGGVIDLDEAPATPTGGSVTRRLLPVASLPCATPAMGCASAADLHRRSALLERVVSALGSYRDATASATRSQEVLELGRAAHVELFVAQSLAFLEGGTREEKCTAYRRALEHARFVGFDDASTVAVRRGWEGTLASARAFYKDTLSTQVPAALCELQPATTKAATESALRAAVDERIRDRVEREVDATKASLASKETQYATLLQRSAIAVPTKQIFALKRAVEDSATLEGFVTGDTLFLQKAPPNGKSYLERVRETLAHLEEIRQRGDRTEISALEAEARGRLTEMQAVLARHVATLREIATLPELDATTRASMPACATIPPALTEQNFVAYADSWETCVTQVARAYSSLKDRRGDAPTYLPFLEKVTALSRAFVATANPPRP
jgi:hypothetical protein